MAPQTKPQENETMKNGGQKSEMQFAKPKGNVEYTNIPTGKPASSTDTAQAIAFFNKKALDVAGAVKLTSQQFESNRQEQRDEVMALKSIFDSDFLPLKGEFDKKKKEKEEAHNIIYRINIRPEGAGPRVICLYFNYPVTYPSNGPPALCIRAEWLTAYGITSLHQQLQRLCRDTEGQVVVYTLATWLQEESWCYLMSRNSVTNPVIAVVAQLNPNPMTMPVSHNPNNPLNHIPSFPSSNSNSNSTV